MCWQGLPASVCPERGELCYYAKAGAPPPGCLQQFSVDIRMKGKRTTPKWRRVCEACSVWLLQERLATVGPPCVTVSPPDLARVSDPYLHSRWLCFVPWLCFAKDSQGSIECEQPTPDYDVQDSASVFKSESTEIVIVNA